MKNLLRKLAYATVVIGALAVTIRAAAGTSGGTAAVAAEDYRVLMADGKIFVMSHTGWTEENNVSPIPIPASQVAYFGGLSLIATNGDGWVWDAPWVNIGPPPGGAPIAVQPTTWGVIKATIPRGSGN